MSSPFPGVDPYIEAQGLWEGFHLMTLACCCESLNVRLPSNYLATLAAHIDLVDRAQSEHKETIPDVLVARRGRRSAAGRGEGAAVASATIEPVRIPLPRSKVEVRNVWIEIHRMPGRTPVSVIELLSPTNKTGDGFAKYQRKRRATIRHKLHLIEIDLLLGGQRLPMEEPLPPGDFFALVSRAEERLEASVYAWTIRDPLPTIPIPLRKPDADVGLDLAAHFATAYNRGRYALGLDYSRPLATLKKAADRTWAERTARAARR